MHNLQGDKKKGSASYNNSFPIHKFVADSLHFPFDGGCLWTIRQPCMTIYDIVRSAEELSVYDNFPPPLPLALSFSLSLSHFLSEDEEKPNVEVIILVCTGAAAMFLWLMLILFIRKLRKVGRSNRYRLVLFYSLFFFCLPRNPNMWKVQKVIEVIYVVMNLFSVLERVVMMNHSII